MMRDAILNFHTQFEYQPKIENEASLERRERVIVLGMGGSNLAPGLLNAWDPALQISSHRDYGLPAFPDTLLRESMIIASSASGDTEETISGFEEALRRGFKVAAVAIGGKLLARAKELKVPYIQLPDVGIQPRMMTGYASRALLALMGNADGLTETGALAALLKPGEYEEIGRGIAQKLKDSIPVIYASSRNAGIASNWKIKFNESGKVPAFWNVFPELNHNEMTGFAAEGATAPLSRSFHFIFLRDNTDHPKIHKRMEVLGKLYAERKLPSDVVSIGGQTPFHKIFSALIIGDWAAFHTAGGYGVPSEEVPMVEEFKKLIKD